MNRRRFLLAAALAAFASLFAWEARRRARLPAGHPETDDDMFDRVTFVCSDKGRAYSPGVYLHGTGGSAGLQLVSQAAPYLSSEVGDAAAGLCGYLFKMIGDEAARGGVLSLYDTPKPSADGSIDWQSYCGPNVDLVLIRVDAGIAELYSGSADLKSPTKSLVRSITGLRFGR